MIKLNEQDNEIINEYNIFIYEISLNVDFPSEEKYIIEFIIAKTEEEAEYIIQKYHNEIIDFLCPDFYVPLEYISYNLIDLYDYIKYPKAEKYYLNEIHASSDILYSNLPGIYENIQFQQFIDIKLEHLENGKNNKSLQKEIEEKQLKLNL